MKSTRPLVLGCGLLAALAAGCGDDETNLTVTLTGHIRDALTQEPASGVEVCIHGSALPCATSDGDGNYTLADVPANARVWVSYNGPDRFPLLSAKEIGTEDLHWTNNVFNTTVIDLQASLLGTTIDAAMGHISGGVFDSTVEATHVGVAGISVSLSPKEGDGPFYSSEKNLPDAKLTASSTGGAFFILNVPPGDYVLTFEGGSCVPNFGWLADGAANTAEIRVVTGHASWVNYVCE